MNHTGSVTTLSSKQPLNPRYSELQEKICRRAYELFEQRGRIHGHDLDDWLKAEAEITRKRRSAVA